MTEADRPEEQPEAAACGCCEYCCCCEECACDECSPEEEAAPAAPKSRLRRALSWAPVLIPFLMIAGCFAYQHRHAHGSNAQGDECHRAADNHHAVADAV